MNAYLAPYPKNQMSTRTVSANLPVSYYINKCIFYSPTRGSNTKTSISSSPTPPSTGNGNMICSLTTKPFRSMRWKNTSSLTCLFFIASSTVVFLLRGPGTCARLRNVSTSAGTTSGLYVQSATSTKSHSVLAMEAGSGRHQSRISCVTCATCGFAVGDLGLGMRE